jgi:hypothetical protein
MPVRPADNNIDHKNSQLETVRVVIFAIDLQNQIRVLFDIYVCKRESRRRKRNQYDTVVFILDYDVAFLDIQIIIGYAICLEEYV